MAEHPRSEAELRAEVERLREELAAEKAGSRHWREVARRRESALAELKQRTSIRAVLSAERRTAKLRAALRRVAEKAKASSDAVAVAASGLATSKDLEERRRRLDRFVAEVESSAARDDPMSPTGRRAFSGRSLLVVRLGNGSPAGTSPSWPDDAAPSRVVSVDDEEGLALEVESAGEDLVGVVADTTEVLTAGCWSRLAAALDGTTVAVTATVVHPSRRPPRTTPHDLLVRSAGIGVQLDAAGVPHLVALAAGEAPGTSDERGAVVATSGALVLLDRAAVRAAGGWVSLGSLDASAIDLSLRLRSNGGAVRWVRDVVAIDHRPVTKPSALDRPVDEGSAEWRRMLERHGPALRRAGEPRTDARLDLVVTVASPMRKVAEQWGDWHLAEALARALEVRGHHVRVQALDEIGSPRSLVADVHLVLRGLARVQRSEGQAHVLWVISHPEDLDDGELDAADLVLVASERFAQHLRTRTRTPVEVLLQATDAERFRPLAPDPAHRHEVTVVGKSRDVMRPMVRDALAAGLRPAVYGSGWNDLIDPSLVVSEHVPNADLPRVYASAGVVLNDHWDTMRAWGFVSNRIFDVLACGTPVVSDPVPGLADAVGDLVATWNDPEDLASAVRAALATDREEFAERARMLVLERHTFDHRAAELEAALRRHGLGPS